MLFGIFFFWLTSLSMIIPSYKHVAASNIISFFFMAEQYSIVYIYTHRETYNTSSLTIYVSGHLGCFHVLPFVNSVAVNIKVCVSFWITVLSGHMSQSRIAASYGTSIFSFLEHLHLLYLYIHIDTNIYIYI